MANGSETSLKTRIVMCWDRPEANSKTFAKKTKKEATFLDNIPPLNSELNCVMCVYYFCMGFKLILKFGIFWAVCGPIFQKHCQNIRMADFCLLLNL